MGQDDLITIGMSCFNAQDTIARAITAAMDQDWPYKEIVVVDDCSDDNSVQVIKQVIQDSQQNAQGKPPQITLVEHEKNQGFAGALNSIIKQAKGTFIAIFDDDDESDPHRLTAQHQTILDYEKTYNPSLAACYASGQRVYPNGYIKYFDAIGAYPKVPVGDDVVRYHLFARRPKGVFYGNGTPSCNVMLRKAVYDEIGLYDVNLRRTEDCDFAIRLGKKGGHFIGCRKRLVTQYPSDGMDKKPFNNYESDLRLIEKYRDDLMGMGRYGYALSWAKMKYHHYAGQKMRALWTFLGLCLHHPVLAIGHFLRAAPRRLIHEWKMRSERY